MKYISIIITAVLLMSGCSMKIESRNIYDNEDLLWRAVSSGVYELAVEAIENDADINHFSGLLHQERINNNRKTDIPVLISLFNGHFDIAKLLLEKGADANCSDDTGQSLLQYCAEFYPQMIETAIAAGADMSYKDSNGNTALEYSVNCQKYNNECAYNILRRYGAIPSQRTLDAIMGHISVDKYGILRDIIINVQNAEVDKSVSLAFQGFGDEVIQSFANSNNKQLTMGGVAAFCDVETFKALYSEEYIINDLLIAAILYENKNMVEYIASEYGDKITECERGYLYYAARNDNIEIVNSIFKSQIPYSIEWAAVSAIENNNLDILKCLLNNGLDPNATCLMGSMLKNAVFFNNSNAARMLLEYGANVNGGNDVTYGEPIILAAENGYLNTMQVLVDYGADINCEDVTGITPLIVAIKNGWIDCVKCLVDNGAKLESNYNNKSILEIAQNTGSIRIFRYISENIN